MTVAPSRLEPRDPVLRTRIALARRSGALRIALGACALALAVGCAGDDGAVTTASAFCLDCHPAATLTGVKVRGSAREVVDQLGDGFGYEPGSRVVFPRRGAHAARDLEACRTCHVGHSTAQDYAQNRNVYPQPALGLLYAGGTDCASGCHDWLKEPVFQTGFTNLFRLLPYWEGPLDPYSLLETSAAAAGAILVTGDNAPKHRQILREGWQWDGQKLQSSTMSVERVAPGCGGCHDLSGEARHGEMPSCNDCHWFRTTNPAGANGRFTAHRLLITTTDAFVPFAAPPQRTKGSCVFCHVSGENGELPDDPLTRRQCYNCHVSGHHTLTAPASTSFWETLPIGEPESAVRQKKAEFDAAHPQG